MRTKQDAEERGEDLDRKKNWEYTIEENDEWEKKKRRKERNADFQFRGTPSPYYRLCGVADTTTDEEQQARKRYKKDLGHLKPDLTSYNKQKELALAGTGSSSGLTMLDSQGSVCIFKILLLTLSEYVRLVADDFIRAATGRRVTVS